MRGGIWPSREGFFFFFFSHKDWSCQRGGQRDTQPPPTKLYTHYSTACLCTSVSISFYHTRAQFEKPGIPASMKFLKSWISTHKPNPTKTKSNMKLCLEIYISHNQAAWLHIWRRQYFLEEFDG